MQACLLIVENDPNAYVGLHSVLLYPDEFVVKDSDEDEAGVVTEGERVLSGQTFDTARIVLSWRDVQESGAEDEALQRRAPRIRPLSRPQHRQRAHGARPFRFMA